MGETARRSVAGIAVWGLIVAGCGGGTGSTTTEVPATTVMSSTTGPATTTTPTEVPQPDTMVLGTLQVGFVPSGDGASLPQVPFDLWLSITGDDTTVDVLFEDPEPGTAFGEGRLSMTIRSFAAVLPPGDYVISRIVVAGSGFGPEPVDLPIPIDQNPRFRVADTAPCTFIGNVTILAWRLPPGDFESIRDLVTDLAPPEGAILTFIKDEGSLVSSLIGLDLMENVMEGDFAAHSWWLDGHEVDAGACETQFADFGA